MAQNTIHRDAKDFIVHLQKQSRLLKKSKDEFDKGDDDEILRMALHVRILAHDSLLEKVNPSIRMLNTCPPIKQNTTLGGIVSLNLGKPMSWSLLKNNTPKWVSLKEWWEGTVLCLGTHEFDRRWFIKEVADTDGGAHVDRQLKEDYFTFKNQGLMGFEIARGGKLSNEPFPSPINLIISQITVEMLESLKVELQRHNFS